MSIIKKLTKVGNSSAIVLDKAILEHMGLREGDQVQLTLSGSNLIVQPTVPTVPDDEFREAMAAFDRERAELMRRLA